MPDALDLCKRRQTWRCVALRLWGGDWSRLGPTDRRGGMQSHPGQTRVATLDLCVRELRVLA